MSTSELISIHSASNSGAARHDFGSRADLLALVATRALIEEANLTPKPGLVDCRGRGAHADLTLEMMHRSARCLFPTFKLIARISEGKNPTRQLRELLGVVGRNGENRMLVETQGCNTHRGAIWTLGLLVAGAAAGRQIGHTDMIAGHAAQLARFRDRFSSHAPTNGSAVTLKFGAKGARGEAQDGFPHIVKIGLPALLAARAKGASEDRARLDALMAIMSSLVDTCLLHRGGLQALDAERQGARTVLEGGGTGTSAGAQALMRLDALLLDLRASPGGSADLLAGALFLDFLARPPQTSGELSEDFFRPLEGRYSHRPGKGVKDHLAGFGEFTGVASNSPRIETSPQPITDSRILTLWKQ